MKAEAYYGGADLISLSGSEVVMADPGVLPHLRLGANVAYIVNKTGGTVTVKNILGSTQFTIATAKVARVSCYDTTGGGTWRGSIHDLLEV